MCGLPLAHPNSILLWEAIGGGTARFFLEGERGEEDEEGRRRNRRRTSRTHSEESGLDEESERRLERIDSLVNKKMQAVINPKSKDVYHILRRTSNEPASNTRPQT